MSTPMLPRERCDDTPENLVDAGDKHIGDWVFDDEPATIRHLEQTCAYVNRFEDVVHWNGEEICNWHASAGGHRLAAE